jgi:endoglucanase
MAAGWPPARALAGDGDAAAGTAAPACGAPARWPAWQSFLTQFLRDDGRILDPSSARGQTVSEAQGYALFFALVDDDPVHFERILRWTEEQLAGGDLSLHLPAWTWGRRDDGSWGVLDDNSAADADLWLAYALGEAGRLWRERRYVALSSLLAERILREETAVLPGLGRSLLPGARGFVVDGATWRLNPSYAPPFLLRWLATRSGDARWLQVLHAAQRLLLESAPGGFAPDWALYRSDGAGGGFTLDEATPGGRGGSYGAIRTYLWLGLTSARDPERAALLQHFAPMAAQVARTGLPPERVDARDGRAEGTGPPGFSAALLPFLQALDRPEALRSQEARLIAEPVPADAYYECALRLFGTGWREGRYAFAADGSLLPAWAACAGAGPSP